MDADKVQPKVLHLDDGRGWRGGQHQVLLLLDGLHRLGIPQALLARPDAPLAERARAAGIDVRPLRCLGDWDPFAARRVADAARSLGCNLLHAHTGHAHAIGLVAARRTGADVRLVTTRRVDFAVKTGPFSRHKYRSPDQHFIAISQAVRHALLRGGVADERIDVVASGVPPLDPLAVWPRERVRRLLGIAGHEIAIVNVGALTDHKGQRWLVDAAPLIIRQFPDARIHLIGHGEERTALARRITATGTVGKVVLHGFLPEARLMLAGFDLFVSCSYLEGLGTAVLDAMLAGLPVVAAAAGGVPEVVAHEQTGRLVPPRDPAALAQAVITSLRDPESTGQMAAAGRQLVAERFSAAAMVANTVAVYQKLLAPFLK